MKNCSIVFLLVTIHFIAGAQESPEIKFINSTFVATDSLLPFWFTANQSGKIRSTGSLMNLTDLKIEQSYPEDKTTISYTWGLDVLAAFSENNYFQLNQAFMGLAWKGWELKAGMYHEPTRYAGLSTANGNLAQSQNARPYPRIRIATQDYKPVPLLKNWLNYKAGYSEGLLNDERYVDNSRLHHKSLYLQVQLSSTLKMHAGLEHFVLWGGTSPEENIGKMPTGIKDYVRYVFGAAGDESFPETDQRNVAGNHLGTWQFQVQKQFQEIEVSIYLSHLFEELSGLKWRNWPDNLLGLHLKLKDKDQLVTDVVYEYTNTRQQSILGTEDDPDPGNYFRHGIYQSSFTFHQQMMGSPLFFPVITDEGIARGIGSNRLYAHHLGLRGSLNKHLQWKGMITRIHHFGVYTEPFEKPQEQFSGILELYYLNPGVPFELGLSAASDVGNIINPQMGVQIWILKTMNP